MHQLNPDKGYPEIIGIKAKIDKIKSDSYEGLRIRARIDEKIHGEKLSSYLIKKQKTRSDNYMAQLVIDNNIITNPKAIIYHATKFYENLYEDPISNVQNEIILLDTLSSVITQDENLILIAPILEQEVLAIIKKMNLNKAPGEDGLSVEFYLKFWSVIKYELVEVLNYMLTEHLLSKSQKNGIITLFYKNGDKFVLKNWRPITLLCVDYKIFTKIIVNRLKPLLVKFISPEQFCSVSGRNILNCNIILRDLLNYVTEKNEQMALISLDFKQAFDRVNINFVFKTMNAVGFSNIFINCIKGLYTNITSKLKINNELGNRFIIKRGVRQGCPLSIILFIIYQETLYRLIKMNSMIKPVMLPNALKLKLLGYADDSNVFIKSENDLQILYNILNIFGSATGAELNHNKTKIMGFGSWKDKTNSTGEHFY